MTKLAETKAQQATLQDLIERLGIPPASICLDWAWQLRQLAPQSPTELSVPSHFPRSRSGLRQANPTASSHGDWSPLALDAEGKLHWVDNAAAHTVERDAQCAIWLTQLVRWSGSATTALAQTNGTATLEQRTLAWAHAQDVAPRAEKPSSSPTCIASSVMQAQRTRSPVKSTRPERIHRPKTVLAVGLIGLLLTSAIFYCVARSLSRPLTPTAQVLPLALEPRTAESHSDSSNNNSAALLNHPLALSTDAIAHASTVSSAGSITLHNFPRSPVVSSSVSEAAPGVADTSSPPNQLVMATTDIIPGQTNASVSPNALGSLNFTAERDVLSELTELSKSAEANVSEQPLPDAMSAAGSAPPPHLTLETFPMNQLQKLDKSLRPRQPSWQLRLAVSEGLEVIPATAQTLAQEQQLSWTIRATEPDKSTEVKPWARGVDPKPGTSLVIVQAQLSGKRDPSLRWRIVATSEKYAQIALPLDPIWLDSFQDVLSNTASGLQQRVQQLKELSRAEGLPSQTRRALSAQSRATEMQRKQAAELLEIVADVNQMVGWMDGQIEVHGELLDTAASPSTTLLQF
ncbi:MAG: hypothetical protein KDA51_12860, partial [Planctomycetales bacterium]|nr:hypothetical protein [Planctomycetales bacterium]